MFEWLTRQRRIAAAEAVKYRNHGDDDDRINAFERIALCPGVVRRTCC